MQPNQAGFLDQYQALKAERPGFILFCRRGEFYEVFGPDAQTVGDVAGLAVVARIDKEKGTVLQCGVPVDGGPECWQTLVDRGVKVAVAEETKRGRAKDGDQEGAK